MTQNNLGGTLAALGERQGGPEGQRWLGEAVEAFRLALAVYTRDDLPQNWARTQSNLGNALRPWASGRAGRRASGGWPRRSRPSAWPSPSSPAATCPRTGPWPRTTWAAPPGLGERQSGPEGQRRLAEAVEASRPPSPSIPATTCPSMGHHPERPGPRARGPGRAAGRAGGPAAAGRGGQGLPQRPTVRTRDDLPQPWARTQGNLGRALQILVRLGGFPASLDQVDRLAEAKGTRDDPVAQASLRTLAIVGQFATNQDAEASRAGAPGRFRRTPAGRLPPRLGLDSPARAPGAIGRPAHPGPSRGPGEAPRRSQSGK